jgi:hypothetical protein
MRRWLPALALIPALAACAVPPELESALGPDPAGSDYPDLLPYSEIKAVDTGDPAATAEADAALAARAAALRARAAKLKALN